MNNRSAATAKANEKPSRGGTGIRTFFNEWSQPSSEKQRFFLRLPNRKKYTHKHTHTLKMNGSRSARDLSRGLFVYFYRSARGWETDGRKCEKILKSKHIFHIHRRSSDARAANDYFWWFSTGVHKRCSMLHDASMLPALSFGWARCARRIADTRWSANVCAVCACWLCVCKQYKRT